MTCGAYASDRYPRNAPPAPSNIAERADSLPLSRIWPTGNATAAWNITHTPSNQKMWAPCQPCASDSVSSADVNAYSEELMAIIEIHGSHTIQARDRPRMSRSVSPTRYTRPLSSTTSRYAG